MGHTRIYAESETAGALTAQRMWLQVWVQEQALHVVARRMVPHVEQDADAATVSGIQTTTQRRKKMILFEPKGNVELFNTWGGSKKLL